MLGVFLVTTQRAQELDVKPEALVLATQELRFTAELAQRSR